MSDSTPSVPSYYDRPIPVDVFVVPQVRRRYWLHIVLLVLTIFTTLVVGARLQNNFLEDRPAFSLPEEATWGAMFPVKWIAEHPSRIMLGVPFAATLMLILVAHELGHYLYCVRYGVQATLPYFIPAPTLIGTLGAFIRIRSPIRSREALFDIGIAGPIAGFAVAVVVLFAALLISPATAATSRPDDIVFGYPLIFHVVHYLMNFGSPTRVPLDAVHMHPMAIAAWVGMFATALNLLPGGQLDGGHIVYSISPKAHKYVSWLTIGILIPLAVRLWVGWLVWAILLALTGLRHPQVPTWPGLSAGRKWLALLALVLLILTFIPIPFDGSLMDFLR
jgi:membrane-associated protease RseP (regulator of RpoE activity)